MHSALGARRTTRRAPGRVIGSGTPVAAAEPSAEDARATDASAAAGATRAADRSAAAGDDELPGCAASDFVSEANIADALVGADVGGWLTAGPTVLATPVARS